MSYSFNAACDKLYYRNKIYLSIYLSNLHTLQYENAYIATCRLRFIFANALIKSHCIAHTAYCVGIKKSPTAIVAQPRASRCRQEMYGRSLPSFLEVCSLFPSPFRFSPTLYCRAGRERWWWDGFGVGGGAVDYNRIRLIFRYCTDYTRPCSLARRPFCRAYLYITSQGVRGGGMGKPCGGGEVRAITTVYSDIVATPTDCYQTFGGPPRACLYITSQLVHTARDMLSPSRDVTRVEGITTDRPRKEQPINKRAVYAEFDGHWPTLAIVVRLRRAYWH